MNEWWIQAMQFAWSNMSTYWKVELALTLIIVVWWIWRLRKEHAREGVEPE